MANIPGFSPHAKKKNKKEEGERLRQNPNFNFKKENHNK